MAVAATDGSRGCDTRKGEFACPYCVSFETRGGGRLTLGNHRDDARTPSDTCALIPEWGGR